MEWTDEEEGGETGEEDKDCDDGPAAEDADPAMYAPTPAATSTLSWRLKYIVMGSPSLISPIRSFSPGKSAWTMPSRKPTSPAFRDRSQRAN